MKITKVILSCNEDPKKVDDNAMYSQFWCLVAPVWQRVFGVEITLIYITNKTRDDPTVKKFEEYGEVILQPPIENGDIPISIQSKVIRMYSAGKYGDHTVMLGDIDMIPLNLTPFLTKLQTLREDAFVTFGDNAYDHTVDAGKFQMNFAVTKGYNWLEIVNPENKTFEDCLKDWCNTSNPIDGKEAVNQPFNKFSDESLLRMLCTKWSSRLTGTNSSTKNKWNELHVGIDRPIMDIPLVDGKRPFCANYLDRLDRNGENIVLPRQPGLQPGSINLGGITDLHCLRPIQKYINSYPQLFQAMQINYPKALTIETIFAPYITGNHFRSFCDYIIDESFLASEQTIKSGKVFVKIDLLQFFFDELFPKFKAKNCKIILVTHNGDLPAPNNFRRYLDDPDLIHWFGQNCNVKPHPKFTCIPIGFANWQLDVNAPTFKPHSNQITLQEAIDAVKEKDTNFRKIYPKVYANFQHRMDSHGHRKDALTELADNPCIVTATQRLPFKEYLIELSNFAFCASPHGNGLDCHRTYEAIVMGVIPIVKTSTLDPLYKRLPVLIVKEWSDINQELLHKTLKKYNGKSHLFAENEFLTPRYWEKKLHF